MMIVQVVVQMYLAPPSFGGLRQVWGWLYFKLWGNARDYKWPTPVLRRQTRRPIGHPSYPSTGQPSEPNVTTVCPKSSR